MSCQLGHMHADAFEVETAEKAVANARSLKEFGLKTGMKEGTPANTRAREQPRQVECDRSAAPNIAVCSRCIEARSSAFAASERPSPYRARAQAGRGEQRRSRLLSASHCC